MIWALDFNKFTAHGYEDWAQEKPPEDGEHDDDSPLLRSPALVELHEKEDISLEVSPPPQEGQLNSPSLSEGNTSCSKILPHLLHLNSNMGISILLG